MQRFKHINNGVMRKGVMLCVLILLVSGCTALGAKTNVLPPTPMIQGSLVTNEWSYNLHGVLVRHAGEWIHIPAKEAGELLLWIEHVEAVCR